MNIAAAPVGRLVFVCLELQIERNQNQQSDRLQAWSAYKLLQQMSCRRHAATFPGQYFSAISRCRALVFLKHLPAFRTDRLEGAFLENRRQAVKAAMPEREPVLRHAPGAQPPDSAWIFDIGQLEQ